MVGLRTGEQQPHAYRGYEINSAHIDDHVIVMRGGQGGELLIDQAGPFEIQAPSEPDAPCLRVQLITNEIHWRVSDDVMTGQCYITQLLPEHTARSCNKTVALISTFHV